MNSLGFQAEYEIFESPFSELQYKITCHWSLRNWNPTMNPALVEYMEQKKENCFSRSVPHPVILLASQCHKGDMMVSTDDNRLGSPFFGTKLNCCIQPFIWHSCNPSLTHESIMLGHSDGAQYHLCLHKFMELDQIGMPDYRCRLLHIVCFAYLA